MTSHPLTDWWDYTPVTVRCPCGRVLDADDASTHAVGHFFDSDLDP